jgi:DNA polymerase-3 subunit epsilon
MSAIDKIRRLISRGGLSDRAYRFLFDPEPVDEAVALDCETTGFDPWKDQIVSVAAIRIVGRRIQASTAFRALVRPDAAVRPASIKIHQLREIDLAGARTMSEVLPDLLHFIGSRPLVGYWIDFDVRMLDRHIIAMIDTRLPNRRIDISKLYYDRKFGSAPPGTRIDLRYATILSDLAFPARAQHDAFEDALGAAESYLVLEDMRERGARLPRQVPTAHAPMPLA